tara:strand:+ start:2673 stop:2861 length:189 start_codon:yes stop_codon:yes gene_type:complete
MSNSNWHGRTHRTIDSAFGPHSRNQLDPMRRNPTYISAVVNVLIAVALIAVMAITLFYFQLQ